MKYASIIVGNYSLNTSCYRVSFFFKQSSNWIIQNGLKQFRYIRFESVFFQYSRLVEGGLVTIYVVPNDTPLQVASGILNISYWPLTVLNKFQFSIFLNLFKVLMADVFLVKLHSVVCHWTSLVISQWLGAVRQQASIWAKVGQDFATLWRH